jgi:DNA polymerase sigma
VGIKILDFFPTITSQKINKMVIVFLQMHRSFFKNIAHYNIKEFYIFVKSKVVDGILSNKISIHSNMQK